MGEEAKQEQAKAEAEAEVKAEEKKEEEKPKEEEKKKEEEKGEAEAEIEEKKKEEEKEEEAPPKPPAPCVLFVDLHCVGCAKKIHKYIMKIRGVEEVVIDMAKNEVTIKGIVEPQAICNIITKKTKRRATVISPLPAAEGEPIPEVVNSQVSGPVTVELNVNMHCEACAEQLKKKILQMRGVQTAVTEFNSGKVVVTGTMDANKLVDYVYRRTKKQAKIVPQLEPEPQPEPEPEKKEENKEAAEDGKKEEEKKEEEKAQEEGKKEEGGENKEEKGGEEGKKEENNNMQVVYNYSMEEDLGMKRMMYYYQYPPLYVIERLPPPQLFSDENPNACCIS